MKTKEKEEHMWQSASDVGEEEVDETWDLAVRKSREKTDKGKKDKREEEERKDAFDIRLGPKPRSRYEPLSLSADGQH